MHHGGMTEIVHHPEYGPCIWATSDHVQKPLSWRHVAWRAPRPAAPLRVRNMIDASDLAMLKGIAIMLRDEVTYAIGSGGFAHPTLPRMRGEEPRQMHKRTLIREWRGTIPCREDVHPSFGGRMVLRIQQRLGLLTFVLAKDLRNDRNTMVDASLPIVMNGPIDAVNHLYALSQDAIGMPRAAQRDVDDENREIGNRIVTAACSIMPYREKWSVAGSLRPGGSPLSDTLYLAEDDPTKAIGLAPTPSFDSELRDLMSVDAEHNLVQIDGGIGISLEGPPFISPRAIDPPSPMDVLRMIERHGGSCPVLLGTDGTEPSHPPNAWLRPLDEARAFGFAC